jgi:GntR family transcriptional repressor for pyruvate dehydrogenase complex
MVKIKPVVRNSLVDTVADQIRNLIEQGHLVAGERLPSESELVERLCVSRSVLREAVSRLETMGLVSVQRGRGMFVGDPRSLSSCVQMVRTAMAITPREMEQFAEFRAAVECISARKAAERATPEDLADLEEKLRQIDQVDDYHEGIRRDFIFHLKIVEMTGNALMKNVMEVIQQFVLAGMVQTTPAPRNREGSQRLHRAIFEAIRSGNPDAAEKAMQSHMDMIAEALQKRAKVAGKS